MYIKKYWGNFIGGSDDSLNLVAFLEDQKKEEIPLSEIFAKIGLDKQNWDFRQTVEYLEFTHSDGVEMDFHFAIDVVTDLAAILLECSVSGSVNLQDLDEYNTPGDACLQAAGLSSRQLEALTASTGEEDSHEDGFWVQYGYSILAMILCLMSASYVIRAVVEEKDSRLVELLLVSVKPMALLAGKILAVMAFTFGWLLAMLAGFGVSCGLTAGLMGPGALQKQLSGLLAAVPRVQEDLWQAAGVLLVLLVSLGLGYLTMSLIGGVAGACCSGMEEAGEATGPVMLLTMAGYLASCVVGAVPSGPVAVFSTLCPVVSIFCAPVQFAGGNVSIWLVLASWVIQAAVIWGLLTLASRVYAGLIVHRGSRVKLRELMSMAKGGAVR